MPMNKLKENFNARTYTSSKRSHGVSMSTIMHFVFSMSVVNYWCCWVIFNKNLTIVKTHDIHLTNKEKKN